MENYMSEDFIEVVKENGPEKVSSELKLLDKEELETYNRMSSEKENEYLAGTQYGKGPFITDPDNKIIYKIDLPHYYQYLRDFHHLD